MNKLLFISLFYALSTYGMGISDPNVLKALSQWNKPTPKETAEAAARKKKNAHQNQMKKDTTLLIEKGEPRKPHKNFFLYFCCCASKR